MIYAWSSGGRPWRSEKIMQKSPRLRRLLRYTYFDPVRYHCTARIPNALSVGVLINPSCGSPLTI